MSHMICTSQPASQRQMKVSAEHVVLRYLSEALLPTSTNKQKLAFPRNGPAQLLQYFITCVKRLRRIFSVAITLFSSNILHYRDTGIHTFAYQPGSQCYLHLPIAVMLMVHFHPWKHFEKVSVLISISLTAGFSVNRIKQNLS